MATHIPTVDLSCFGPGGSVEDQKAAAVKLHDACSRFGFVNLRGIGISSQRLDDAFAYSKRLFDLPLEDKLRAPHPPEAMPHRGYSHAGMEKVYSKAERDADAASNGTGEALRKTEDHKESFEIGSEKNDFQPNIYLPDSIYPGFKQDGLRIYHDFHQAGCRILDALCMSLKLDPEETARLKQLHSGQNNQLRLLHYPPIETQKLKSEVIGRMPPHQDWSSFTFLFQDSVGGLELQDPGTKEYLRSIPEQGTCILNVGDMLMRYSNGIYPSAMHRVTLPPSTVQDMESDTITKGRYAIPYFFAPDHEALVEPMSSLCKGSGHLNYEAVRWCDYGEYMSRHMYKGTQEVSVEAN
ncbi:Clavaminate synthase-like protein [Myriangium duriaei CBS 260.36]|uniref:Clavaminate synthase-like protein n=1 Tax=Myriangium duriaei CBS 260.36 TaxID=1168546 RepID=A0A9P4MHG5_9PEZI|nr:Clavaminate synthase-like protein [Myriangium duriaei CBS 260.36]